jgi:hypothetical protein
MYQRSEVKLLTLQSDEGTVIDSEAHASAIKMRMVAYLFIFLLGLIPSTHAIFFKYAFPEHKSFG